MKGFKRYIRQRRGRVGFAIGAALCWIYYSDRSAEILLGAVQLLIGWTG